MTDKRFDLAVLGSGPGGYVAAIRAAQLGSRVAVIEEDRPGGVCLNWGCIPSKALLTGAELAESIRHGETFGVTAGTLHFDYGKVVDHSRNCADRLCKGVQSLLKKNRITMVRGHGRVAGPNALVARPVRALPRYVFRSLTGTMGAWPNPSGLRRIRSPGSPPSSAAEAAPRSTGRPALERRRLTSGGKTGPETRERP